MENRFIFLGILSGIFLIVALPVGIVFFIFVALYYISSNKEENVIVYDHNDESCDSCPDFKKLFNDPQFCEEQEKLR